MQGCEFVPKEVRFLFQSPVQTSSVSSGHSSSGIGCRARSPKHEVREAAYDPDFLAVRSGALIALTPLSAEDLANIWGS